MAVALQPDGRIVVAGQTQNALFQSQVLIVRFEPNGDVDTSFGSSGEVTPARGVANDVAVQPDGKIVVAGDIFPDSAFVARFNTDGTPDTSFQGGGTFVFANSALGSDFIENVTLANDGGIVAIGSSNVIFNDTETIGQLLLMKLFEVCE